ncbi:hypothetical protein [Ciceribacter sp. L1K22]|uniref:hypothetical protein n=1 Tax=Ciceribacter sp. L1K22 TaxID=2820275 RepID=UPI001ABDD852|nr:hypothetical protein [Ciceribacter sp. L1K22]MBO3760674.1 hypothetical protein [Ciceribacter sp. L1K22]
MISILLSIVAAFGLTIMKGWLVCQDLTAGRYKPRNFAVLAVLWLVVVVPGIHRVCTDIYCRYGIRLGWLLDGFVQSASANANIQITYALLTALALLSVYVFGHLLGLIFYGFQRAFKAWDPRAQ